MFGLTLRAGFLVSFGRDRFLDFRKNVRSHACGKRECNFSRSLVPRKHCFLTLTCTANENYHGFLS
jgi:hypothetical protein